MKRIAALAAWLLVAAAPRALAGPGGDGEVKAVSVVPAPGKVEVVIDLQGAVDVQDFTLSNPARLVIDLTGARLTAPATLYDGQNRGGVKNIRYAQFRPDIVRVVIDLDVLKDYQVQKTEGHVRVRIGSERTSFAAWSSTTAGAAAPQPVAPSPAPTAAARVTTPQASEAESAIEQYLAAHAREAAQSRAPRITVTWDNAEIMEVVAGFAAFSGRTIVVSKGVAGKVSAEIKNQPWDLAFNAVLESQSLAGVTLEGGIIQVVNKADLARARSALFTTWMMPPSSVTPARLCDSSTALKARSQGWFLISAETLPATPLLTTMVRPLKAANPATTSMISALSHVTVMRGARDCAASRAWAARYSSIADSASPAWGVVTRAAAVAAADGATGWGAAAPAVALDHAAKDVRSDPMRTRTCPSVFWI